MTARFAHPRGVLAELLDMNPQDIPDAWLHDREIFSLITEYYSPSLEVLLELHDPDPESIPREDAVDTTLDKKTYAERVRTRIACLEKNQGQKRGIVAFMRGLFH